MASGVDRLAADGVERLRPVERLDDAGDAVEVEPAELVDDRVDLVHEPVGAWKRARTMARLRLECSIQ